MHIRKYLVRTRDWTDCTQFHLPGELSFNFGQVDPEEADDGLLVGNGERLQHEAALEEGVVEAAPLHREHEGRHERLVLGEIGVDSSKSGIEICKGIRIYAPQNCSPIQRRSVHCRNDASLHPLQ